MIDETNSVFTKEERREIYRYVLARFICNKFAYGQYAGSVVTRVAAYLYNHESMNIDVQEVGDVSEDFPEFEAQKPEGVDNLGSMTMWFDQFHWMDQDYEKICIGWLEESLKLM